MDKYIDLTRSPRDEGDNEQHDEKNQNWFDALQTAELTETDYDSDGDSENMLEEMIGNINKISEESKERRISIKQDFKDIQTRLDTNKNNLDKIKTQIERVTDVLHKLKTSNTSNVDLNMGDWSKEVEAEMANIGDWSKAVEVEMANEKLLRECNLEIVDLEKALAEDLTDANDVDY